MPVPTVTVDLLDGAGYQKTYADGILRETATRVAKVFGLTGNTTPASAMIRARQAVEALYPLRSPYDPAMSSICLLSGYNVQPLRETDDAVTVTVSYETPQRGDGGADGSPIFTIEEDDGDQSDQTQVDPASEDVLFMNWISPIDPDAFFNDIATITYPQTIRRLVLSGIMRNELLDKYGKAQGLVNDAPWMGYKSGYWRFENFRTQGFYGAVFSRVTCTLMTYKTKDQSVYALMKNLNNGRWLRPPAGEVKRIRDAPYFYGVSTFNGGLKVGTFDTTSFSQLFTIQTAPLP